MHRPRTCPHCRVILGLDSGYYFEGMDVVCSTCKKVVVSTVASAELLPVVSPPASTAVVPRGGSIADHGPPFAGWEGRGGVKIYPPNAMDIPV